jgi:hypothetical protein
MQAARATSLRPSRCSALTLKRVPFLKGLEKAYFLVFGFDRTSKAEVGVEAEVVGASALTSP